jgi:hypothetical protein
MRDALAEQFFDRSDVLGGGSAPLILPEDDVLQRLEIVQERTLIIGPLGFVGIFGLKSPEASEFRHPDFSFTPFRVSLLPYVLTPHPAGILH